MFRTMTSHNVTPEVIAQAQARFKNRLAAVTAQIHNRPLNSALDEWLNAHIGASPHQR